MVANIYLRRFLGIATSFFIQLYILRPFLPVITKKPEEVEGFVWRKPIILAQRTNDDGEFRRFGHINVFVSNHKSQSITFF